MQLSPLQQFKALTKDGILWKAERLQHNAKGNDRAISLAIEEVCKTLSLVKNEYIRNKRTDEVAKILSTKPAIISKNVGQIIKSREISAETEEEFQSWKFPKWMGPEAQQEIRMNGFTQVHKEYNKAITGIHISMGKDTKLVSNCVLKPLYLVKNADPADNKQLIEVRSADDKAVIEFMRSSLIEVQQFRKTLWAGNNMVWSGNIDQLILVMQTINHELPVCDEINVFGWQPESFWCYTDRFYTNNTLIELNEYGIGKHVLNNKDYLFYSPSKSSIFKDARKGGKGFQQFTPFNYKQSPTTFEQWAELISKTYLEKAKFAIAFVFITLFRDIILKKDNSCPHLYCWGEPGSGKSKILESLNFLFFSEPRKFNLNSGTDYALSQFVEDGRNVPHMMNEADEETVTPIRMQWMKGWFDDEGRPKGNSKKGKTEIMRCNGSITIAGQKLVNGDNNALPSRCIVLEFKNLEKEQRSAEQVKAFDILMAYQSNGGFNSCLTEILTHRQFFETKFPSTFDEIFKEARVYMAENKMRWNDRIVRNHGYLLAMAKLAAEKFRLPWVYDTFFKETMAAAHDLAERIAGTDSASSFWQIIATLANQRVLVNGYDYKIINTAEVTTTTGRVILATKGTKRILKLRFANAHSLYMEHARKQTGKTGINKPTLEAYLRSKEYWIGNCAHDHFKAVINGKTEATNSSSYIFNVDMLEELGYFLDYSTERVHHTPTVDTPPQTATAEPENPPF